MHVLLILGQIVVHHHDDVRIRNAVLVHDLVGVTNIGLMPVVVPAVGASDEHGPVLSILGQGADSTEKHNTGDEKNTLS